MSSVEREMLAYHEAGHAVVGWMLEHVDPLLKVREECNFIFSTFKTITIRDQLFKAGLGEPLG